MMMLERMLLSPRRFGGLLSRKARTKEVDEVRAGGFLRFVHNGAMTESRSQIATSPVLGVGAVIFNEAREIVLVRRGKPPRQHQWSIPGGHVEWGESVHDALLREVREETALTVEIAGLIDVVDLVTRDDAGLVTVHYVLIDYAARCVAGELRAGSDAAEAEWVPFTRLNDYRLWSETRRIIEAARRLLEVT
jgi:8-oxo-dGTP diphosphatase